MQRLIQPGDGPIKQSHGHDMVSRFSTGVVSSGGPPRPTMTGMVTHLSAGTGTIRLSTDIHPDREAAALQVAHVIATALRSAAAAGRRYVLVLPTGSTPIPVYRHLVEWHRAGELSFRQAVIFNLDEYHGLPATHPQSYAQFMHTHLIGHIDIDPANVHIPRGDLPSEAVGAEVAAYEQAMLDAGGVDLAILGIGANGHIGFNEPGSPRNARTRLVRLHPRTRRDALREFGAAAAVPDHGISMGVGSILAARRIILLATGATKASALSAAIEGPVSPACPASYLQDHSAATVICDEAAAVRFEIRRKPWLADRVDWTPALERAAAIDVAEQSGKALLTCADADYAAHGLVELLERTPVDVLNLEAFRHLHATITGWPGGKPPARRRPGDIARPGDEVHPKTVVVFSPHPDDDVIGMGGTIARLVEQGHQVHIAYQTPGHRAVHDDDLDRHLAFVRGAIIAAEAAPVDFSGADRTRLKALVRRTEATAGAAVVGVAEEHLHFLDCPGYAGNDFGPADTTLHLDLLRRLRPHQIYAAGDLADPNGTHRRCLMALREALTLAGGDDWREGCACLLYRGGWDGFTPGETTLAIPLSEADVQRKRQAILRHQSQKDRAMFLGEDSREFWQRAEDRTRGSAEAYAKLGLPRYVAVECFAHWNQEQP